MRAKDIPVRPLFRAFPVHNLARCPICAEFLLLDPYKKKDSLDAGVYLRDFARPPTSLDL